MKFYTQKISPKGEWIKLQDGDNKLRIVSEFESFGNHYIRETGDSGICIGKEKGCRFCAVGDKPKVNYLCWAIDRKDNKIKLFRFGYSIYEQLVNMSQSEEWGFVSDTMPYDITIKRSGSGLTTKYHILGSPKLTSLTFAEDEELKGKNSVANIISSLKEKEISDKETVLDRKEKKTLNDEEDIPVIDESEENIDLSDIPL